MPKHEGMVHAYYSKSYAKQHGSKRYGTKKKGRTISVTHLKRDASLSDLQYVGLVWPDATT